MVFRRLFITAAVLFALSGLVLVGTVALAFDEGISQPLDSNPPLVFSTGGLIMDQVIIEFNTYAECRAAQAVNR